MSGPLTGLMDMESPPRGVGKPSFPTNGAHGLQYPKRTNGGGIIHHELTPDYMLTRLRNRSVKNSLERIFNEINIIRNVGSPGHLQVRDLGWETDLDTFEENTVDGVKTFHNIIGYRNDPNYKKYLILACHYESKLLPNFVGSTDSAMPCSIILKIVDLLNYGIKTLKKSDIGLKLIFFDGEEAFKIWTHSDSLYGSRHLAKTWSSTTSNSSNETELSKIVSDSDIL
ncbi:unnamed protein product [Schistosoma margrebowiei]|uniref:glutaminyl-peptide cyclotransferase n=1 Tax=Schistosoma margrebowiei TaxID=48269 RepID=A0A183LMY6_9TREM|nr:unnamed protein product [Schistosoma margrebowiei]